MRIDSQAFASRRRVTLAREPDAARIVRLVVGATIYTAAALMLLT